MPTYVPLGTFDRIHAALAVGAIDAGALPIDLRFSGQARYGWSAFPIDAFDSSSGADSWTGFIRLRTPALELHDSIAPENR